MKPTPIDNMVSELRRDRIKLGNDYALVVKYGQVRVLCASEYETDIRLYAAANGVKFAGVYAFSDSLKFNVGDRVEATAASPFCGEPGTVVMAGHEKWIVVKFDCDPVPCVIRICEVQRIESAANANAAQNAASEPRTA